jgi:hypothetical protein
MDIRPRYHWRQAIFDKSNVTAATPSFLSEMRNTISTMPLLCCHAAASHQRNARTRGQLTQQSLCTLQDAGEIDPLAFGFYVPCQAFDLVDRSCATTEYPMEPVYLKAARRRDRPLSPISSDSESTRPCRLWYDLATTLVSVDIVSSNAHDH